MSKISREQIQGIVMGRMSRRSTDEPAGMQPLERREYCTHPEHGPPSMLYVPPGNKYVHYCPACNAKSVLHNHTPTLVCESTSRHASVLGNIQTELEENGILDVKIFLNQERVSAYPVSQIKREVAEVLRLYLDGKAKQVDGIGDTNASA